MNVVGVVGSTLTARVKVSALGDSQTEHGEAAKYVKYSYKSVRFDRVKTKYFTCDSVYTRSKFCRMCGVPYDEMVQFCNFKDTAYLYATKV